MWTRSVPGSWSALDRDSRAGSWKRRGRVRQNRGSRERPAFQESAVAGLPLEGPILDNDVAARKHRLGNASHFAALVCAVIHTHVVGGGTDGLFTIGIEDHDVGIGAHGDRAFLWK